METFHTNYNIQNRICNICSPQSICQLIRIKDSKMSIVCQNCYAKNRPEKEEARVLNIVSLSQLIQGLVKKQKQEMNKIKQVEIKKIVSEKKKQYEFKQYKLIDQIMKNMNEVKQSFFLHLDQYQAKCSKQLRCFQMELNQRKQIVNYLSNFSEDIQLLKFKLIMSNEEGLNQLLSCILNLQKFKQQHINQKHLTSVNKIVQSVHTKINYNLQLFSKISTEINQILEGYHIKRVQLPIIPLRRVKNNYNNQATQRTNQSSQNISVNYSPRNRIISFNQNNTFFNR